jgi:hypothetical protein
VIDPKNLHRRSSGRPGSRHLHVGSDV